MKYFNPVTSSLRHTCLVNKVLLLKNNFSLLVNGKCKTGGRNNSGTITVRYIGGGHKKLFLKLLETYSIISDIPCIIQGIVYDCNRSSFISLIRSVNGILFYYLASTGMYIGKQIYFYSNLPTSYSKGDNFSIMYMNPGSIIHNISLYPFMRSQLTKAAGSYSILVRKDNNYGYLKLSSGKIICVSKYIRASLGNVSNKNNRYVNFGKAGRIRWLGKKSHVRGVAMNPVDHPHGGGEGKKSKNVCARSPWGKLSNGQRLKKNKFIRYYE